MSLQAHLNELKRKHETIKDQIRMSEHQPSTDSLDIKELKRKKLQLKDEISQLNHKIQETVLH